MKKTRGKKLLSITCLCGLAFLVTSLLSTRVYVEDVTRIELWDGWTGNMVEITDGETISDLLIPFQGKRYWLLFIGPSGGWSYRLRFFQGEEQVLEVVLRGGIIDIDGIPHGRLGQILNFDMLQAILDAQ